MDIVVQWLNANSGAIQAIATVVLVVVTIVYAWRTHVIAQATKRQAEASAKMAREMREAKEEALRPVIVIEMPSSNWVPSYESPHTVQLVARLRNIGAGPALNLICSLNDFGYEFNGPARVAFGAAESHWDFNFATGADKTAPRQNDQPTISVLYRDVYDSCFESRLALNFNEERGTVWADELTIRKLDSRKEQS